MKAVIQRVTKASVSVNGEVISSIGKGFCVLLGISRNDTDNDIKYMIRKVLNLRVFEDENGKRWNKSIKDYNYEILCVSQFTLCCKLKGNKPDFHLAMAPELSEKMYEDFIHQLKASYTPDLVKDGKFGAFMQVHIQNDGPVTIEIDSPAATIECDVSQ